MAVREIPREKWSEFLTKFGNQHRGWPVTLEERRGFGKVVAAQNWSLQQLTSDSAQGHEQISITIGEMDRTRITHVVNDPIRLWVQSGEREEQVEIEATDGTLTAVHFSAR